MTQSSLWKYALWVIVGAVLSAQGSPVGETKEPYSSWTALQAESLGEHWYAKGRVGGPFDTRILKTERSYNYKLAATWITPDVVRAVARLLQLQRRLTDDETRALVKVGDEAGDTVIMVEIDPREGSGVIPNDWTAFLQPKGRPDRVVTGHVETRLRDAPSLAGVLRRNYDYDRFWMVFPLRTSGGQPLFAREHLEAELVVRIYDREGRITWRIPDVVRAKQERLLLASPVTQ
jgi:hypothetical protein